MQPLQREWLLFSFQFLYGNHTNAIDKNKLIRTSTKSQCGNIIIILYVLNYSKYQETQLSQQKNERK